MRNSVFKTSKMIQKKNGKMTGAANAKQRRYVISLIIALAALVVVLIVAIAITSKEDTPEQETVDVTLMDRVRKQEVVVSHVESINSFFEKLYAALADGDSNTYLNMYDNPSMITFYDTIPELVDHYGDFKIYITRGFEHNEVAAFVSYDIYFNNISTPAPAVDSYYIYLDTDKNEIKILTKAYTDETINRFMTLISYRNPVRSELKTVENKLYEAMENDSDLRSLYVEMKSVAN